MSLCKTMRTKKSHISFPFRLHVAIGAMDVGHAAKLNNNMKIHLHSILEIMFILRDHRSTNINSVDSLLQYYEVISTSNSNFFLLFQIHRTGSWSGRDMLPLYNKTSDGIKLLNILLFTTRFEFVLLEFEWNGAKTTDTDHQSVIKKIVAVLFLHFLLFYFFAVFFHQNVWFECRWAISN